MQKTTSHDSEVPTPGQQVITACAFIHDNFGGIEKVLLCKRAETKKFLPGAYELPGGHINFGENVSEGLEREIEEELHIKINVGDSFYVFTYENPIKQSHSIEVAYFATCKDQLKAITINPEDHSTYGWFSHEEIISKVVDQRKTEIDHLP